MNTFRRTTPPMPLVFKMAGYCAVTFFTILRALSCASPLAAKDRRTLRKRAPRKLLWERELNIVVPQNSDGARRECKRPGRTTTYWANVAGILPIGTAVLRPIR